MKNALLGIVCLVLGFTVHAEPSRAFIQELAHVAAAGSVYVDLYNTTGTWTRRADSQLRVGTGYGEIVASGDYLGYKAMLHPDVAAYTHLGLSSDPSRLDGIIGMAWTVTSPELLVSLNPEVARISGATALAVNGALFLPLRVPAPLGRLLVGGEIAISDAEGSRTGLALGARWAPRPRVTIDVVVAGDGGSTAHGAVATPAALRVNLGF